MSQRAQGRRIRKAKAAEVKADAMMNQLADGLAAKRAKGETKAPKRKAGDAWPCTAEDLIAARAEGLSWRNMARKLGLANPGQARTAYTELVGVAHNDVSVPGSQRASAKPKSENGGPVVFKGRTVEWDDDTDQDEIINAINGREITVERKVGDYTFYDVLVVSRVKRLDYDGRDAMGPLTVSFNEMESGAFRTVRVADIRSVR